MEDEQLNLVDDGPPPAKRVKLEANGDDGLLTPLTALPDHLSPLQPHGTPKPPSFELLYTLQGHTKGATAVKFSPDGKYLVTSGADSQLLLYDVDLGEFLRAFKSHSAGINDVAWSPDGKCLASASDDKTVRVWSVEAGELLKILRGHTSHVFSCSWAPQGNIVISGSFDETIKIWDSKRGICMRSMPAHQDPISAIQCNRDGTVIASCSFDGLIRLWDLSTGQCLKTVVGETNPPVSAVRFSPNGRYLLAATLDSTLRLWDYVAEKAVKIYTGHTNAKYCSQPTIMPNWDGGTYVAIGSEDGKVWVWDVQTREALASFDAHKDAVVSVSYDPQRFLLATAALERDETRVKIWYDAARTSM